MPAVGDVLGERYRIDGVLGAGAMGTVYRATDLRLEREVAVKVLLPNLARDPGFAARFDREARLLAAINHGAVAAVFDVEQGDPEAGREPFYVMELCDGGSLADLIADRGRLDPGLVVPIIVAVADGLAEMHRQGLIHRDVKPGNILFSGDRPKLADFGLARSEDGATTAGLTEPGTTVGTPSYLAPELLSGAVATAGSDAYALGATAYHALTGRAPRTAETFEDLLDLQATRVTPVSELVPGMGRAFDAPLAAALAPDSAMRPSPQRMATELGEALQGWLDDQPIGGSPAADETVVGAPVAPAPSTVIAPTGEPARPAYIGAASARDSELDEADGGEGSGDLDNVPMVGRADDWTTRIPVLLAIVASLLGVLVLAVLLAPGIVSPGPSVASPSPTTALPSPSGIPTTSPDVSAAIAALDRVVAAIDRARGGRDGLKGGDANELETIAANVRRALQAGDLAAARQAADRLSERARRLARDLDETRRVALLSAIDELLAAIPAA